MVFINLLQRVAKSNLLVSLKFLHCCYQFIKIVYHFYYIHEPSQFATN